MCMCVCQTNIATCLLCLNAGTDKAKTQRVRCCIGCGYITSSVASGSADTVCSRSSVTLTFDRLTLKLVCESHLRPVTFAPNVDMLDLWVLGLFAMYATDGQIDRRTNKSNGYCPLPYGRGHKKQKARAMASHQMRPPGYSQSKRTTPVVELGLQSFMSASPTVATCNAIALTRFR